VCVAPPGGWALTLRKRAFVRIDPKVRIAARKGDAVKQALPSVETHNSTTDNV